MTTLYKIYAKELKLYILYQSKSQINEHLKVKEWNKIVKTVKSLMILGKDGFLNRKNSKAIKEKIDYVVE